MVNKYCGVTNWYGNVFSVTTLPPAGSVGVLLFQMDEVRVGNHGTFLQRVSIACYAERCISYDRFCLTDRLTV